MWIVLRLILVRLIWEEDVCWQLKAAAWETSYDAELPDQANVQKWYNNLTARKCGLVCVTF